MFRVFISAGEASGDLHASNLVKKIQQNTSAPDIYFSGMGGELMRQAGVKIVANSTDLAVIGAVEVLRHLHQFIAVRKIIKRELLNHRPHLLILIDYPGFNLWLAKIAKKMGIKVLYYISPQIWAWHRNRIKKIRRYVDMMAVIFPFEVPFYANAGIPVTLVPHPLLAIVKPTMEKDVAKNTFNLHLNQQTSPIIGLFPGSRKNEIKRLLPVMLQAATLLKNKFPHAQFVLPLASSLNETDLKPYLQTTNTNFANLDTLVIKNQQYDVANVCDAIIATSGTVTLEIALLKIPMVIIYKLAPITYWLAKQVVKIPNIGLCNIVAGKKIVHELIQNDANAENISTEIEKILKNQHYRENMVAALQQVKQRIASPDKDENTGATKGIDEVVLECLSPH